MLHLDVMQSHIRWLMEQPAGAKLNNNLTHALGNSVLFVLDIWNSLTTLATPFEPFLVYVLALVIAMGISLGAAALLDLLSVLTVHVSFLHFVFAKIYSHSLSVLSSLWHLFRGKKRNTLRHRIDSCDYDIDQLLLGTLLFATLFFLFPTLAIYYVFFSLVKLIISVVQAILYTIFITMYSFPFFGLFAHFYKAQQLPGGIWFELLPTVHASGQNTTLIASTTVRNSYPARQLSRNDSEGRDSFGIENDASLSRMPLIKTRIQNPYQSTSLAIYMLLHTRSVPLSALFVEFRVVLSKLMGHYTPISLVSSLIYGNPYPAPPQILEFSQEKIPLGEFWKFLETHS